MILFNYITQLSSSTTLHELNTLALTATDDPQISIYDMHVIVAARRVRCSQIIQQLILAKKELNQRVA